MDSTIRDLFRSLELTLQERLRTIEDVIRAGGHHPSNPNAITVEERMRRLESAVESFQTAHVPGIAEGMLQFRVELSELRAEVQRLRSATTVAADPTPAAAAPVLIPVRPLEGLEVIPKREVVIPDTLSMEDRLLLNKKALKALEAEERGEEIVDEEEVVDENEVLDSENGIEEVEVTKEEADAEEAEVEESLGEEEAEEDEEDEAEAEAEDEEAEEEAAEVELEEFEYKGATYYRDGDGNVYMTDEDGELQEEPIGVWNEAKQRIVVKK